MIFLNLGIRNLKRNKRRTILTAMAIGVGLAALILSDGIMQGMIQNMIKTATSGLLGHGQIHQREYIINPETDLVIDHPKQLMEKLQKEKRVESWSPRAYALGMIASPRNAKNITIVGIDIDREFKTTKLKHFLKKGAFLGKQNSIVIGEKLKEKLGVDLDDKVILTTTEAKTGELKQEIFRIGGITSFGSKEMDQYMAFISLAQLQRLLKIEKNYHEIVLNLKNPFAENLENDQLWANLSSKNNVAKSWSSIAKPLASAKEMSSLSTWVIGIIMMILMTILIINTLFMAIFERIFEFGVVRAIGTDNRHLIIMVLTEATGLGILASIFGIMTGLILATYININGIDYGGIEFNNVTFREPIYFIYSWYQWVLYPLGTIILTAIIGIYPALFTTKLDLARALKKTI